MSNRGKRAIESVAEGVNTREEERYYRLLSLPPKAHGILCSRCY